MRTAILHLIKRLAEAEADKYLAIFHELTSNKIIGELEEIKKN